MRVYEQGGQQAIGEIIVPDGARHGLEADIVRRKLREFAKAKGLKPDVKLEAQGWGTTVHQNVIGLPT